MIRAVLTLVLFGIGASAWPGTGGTAEDEDFDFEEPVPRVLMIPWPGYEYLCSDALKEILETRYAGNEAVALVDPTHRLLDQANFYHRLIHADIPRPIAAYANQGVRAALDGPRPRSPLLQEVARYATFHLPEFSLPQSVICLVMGDCKPLVSQGYLGTDKPAFEVAPWRFPDAEGIGDYIYDVESGGGEIPTLVFSLHQHLNEEFETPRDQVSAAATLVSPIFRMLTLHYLDKVVSVWIEANLAQPPDQRDRLFKEYVKLQPEGWAPQVDMGWIQIATCSLGQAIALETASLTQAVAYPAAEQDKVFREVQTLYLQELPGWVNNLHRGAYGLAVQLTASSVLSDEVPVAVTTANYFELGRGWLEQMLDTIEASGLMEKDSFFKQLSRRPAVSQVPKTSP